MRQSAALALSLILTAPAMAESAEIPEPVRLKSSVVVEDAVLRLGDLFDGLGDLAQTAVARAPAPGSRVELDARWLAALADGYGVAWRPSSALEGTVVARASQTIEGPRIEAELRQALAARGLAGDFSVLLDNPDLRLHLPVTAAPTIGFAALAHDAASGRFTARVVAPAGATPLASATVTGRAEQMTEVPVLQRRMVPGEVITQSDIEWLRLGARRLAGNVVVDPVNLIGKSPRRPIRPDRPVRAADLREPVLVRKNSLVVLRLETERMVLTSQGRALQDGAGGQIIRVMNTKSNTIINGMVADRGVVRVAQTAGTGDNQGRLP